MTAIDMDRALEPLVEVLLTEREPDSVLNGLARTVGEALSADRVLIHRVSYATGEVVVLSEWLNLGTAGATPTRTLLPLHALCGAEHLLNEPGRFVESRRGAPNPALPAESLRALHEGLAVQSALWLAFGHGDDDTFLVLTLHQVTRERVWHATERKLLRRASRLVELGLHHLELRRRQHLADRRYRALFDQSPSMFFIVDRSLRVIEVNPAAADTLGYPPAELLGVEISSIFHPEDVPGVERHLADCLQHQGEVRRWQGRKLRKDGTVLWVREVARALTDPPETFVVCDDVSELREIELALADAQKAESLGLLAAGVAHDFGNVLASIEALAGLARARLAPESPSAKELDQLLVATDGASGLVRQLMAYAGRATFTRRPLKLDGVVRRALNLIRGSIGRRVQIQLELASDLPPVEGDATQLEQVVVNLVLNAARMVEDRGGTVTIAAHREGAGVVLEVTDDGAGMDEATRAKVFEPFFTTRGPGHGLGLAAAAGLVKAHGGRIGVRSAPGRGATFTVELPSTDPTGD